MQRNKQQLRAHIRALKKAMSSQDIAARSKALCDLVPESDGYKQAKTIYGYLPFNQEVQLLPLLRQAMADGKQIALPKCFGREMRFILTTDLSRIRYSDFGAPEPVDDEPIARDPSALVIVPGLAFDRQGYRIGYGGGYYDRFLAQEPEHPTIGLCYDFQLVSQLETDPHDIPVDIVFAV